MPSTQSADAGLGSLDHATLVRLVRALEQSCPLPILSPGRLSTEQGRLDIAVEYGRRRVLEEARHAMREKEREHGTV